MDRNATDEAVWFDFVYRPLTVLCYSYDYYMEYVQLSVFVVVAG